MAWVSLLVWPWQIEREKFTVYISDGECEEGSIWEALRVANENNLTNLRIYININGYGAYSRVNMELLKSNLRLFDNLFIEEYHTTVEDFPFLHDIDAHYHVLNDEEYQFCMELLKDDTSK
jgi:transketolase